MCGKTGTAQLASNDLVERDLLRRNSQGQRLVRRVRARAIDPEIVVAALFENGEHGQLAAPIVRDVLKAYFDKKARLGAAAAADRAHSLPACCSRLRRCRRPRSQTSAGGESINMPAHRSLRDFDWLMLILVSRHLRARRAADLQRHARHALHRSLVEAGHLDPGRLRRIVDRNADRLSHLAWPGGCLLWPVGGDADRHFCGRNHRFRLPPLDRYHQLPYSALGIR